MNVAELIAELELIPGDTQVIVSRDPEGNGFESLHSVDYGHKEKGPRGEMVHPDDVGTEYDPEDLEPAVCLWP